MYYIYHVPGVKIGVSSEPEKRVADQGYSEFEILEEYDCIYEVSEREISLQKEWGYRVDHIPYYKTIEARSAAGVKQGNLNKQKKNYFKEISKLSPATQYKLSKETRDEFTRRYHNGESAASLGKEYGVSRQTIWAIATNRYQKRGHSEE